VLEKNISPGYEGTVFTNVNSALAQAGSSPLVLNFVAGLGGRDIAKADIARMFEQLAAGAENPPDERVIFVTLQVAVAPEALVRYADEGL